MLNYDWFHPTPRVEASTSTHCRVSQLSWILLEKDFFYALLALWFSSQLMNHRVVTCEQATHAQLVCQVRRHTRKLIYCQIHVACVFTASEKCGSVIYLLVFRFIGTESKQCNRIKAFHAVTTVLQSSLWETFKRSHKMNCHSNPVSHLLYAGWQAMCYINLKRWLTPFV